MKVTITVMDCVSCTVVTGYDGADLATLSHALSSRGVGGFALAVVDVAIARVMTYLTVHDGQTLTFTGTQTIAGQLPVVDAIVSVADGGSLVLPLHLHSLLAHWCICMQIPAAAIRMPLASDPWARHVSYMRGVTLVRSALEPESWAARASHLS